MREWSGTDFKLVDTGGWEADVEGIESAIASQAQMAVQLADAVVLVVDGQVDSPTDERIVKMLRASGKPVTLAVNKVDDRESEYLTAEFWKMGPRRAVWHLRHAWARYRRIARCRIGVVEEGEKTSGFTPSHLRRWLWSVARTSANLRCSTSWHMNVPWSMIWPEPP